MSDQQLRIKLKVDADTGELVVTRKEFAKLSEGASDTEQSVNKALGSMEKYILGLASAYVSIQSAMKVVDIAVDFTKTASQFEKFDTVLKTIEGSTKKAEASMEWISDFTKTTPYELANVTDSFVKLKAYGIDPTDGTLRTLGDTASAMGKNLNSAVEAMADAVTGENERLKEFGIKASKAREEITYSWTSSSGEAKSAIVENNAQIIESTLEAIFNSKYEGAMEAQSKTLEGMISKINDSYTIFQKSVMDEGLYDYIKALTKIVGEDLNSAFGVTAGNSGEFAAVFIHSIDGTIRSVGTLLNAVEGVGIGFEASFNTLSATWDVIVIGIVGGTADIIDALNKIPGVNIDNSWSRAVADDAAKSFWENINGINTVLDDVVDYENYASDFVARTSAAFKAFKEEGDGAISGVNKVNSTIGDATQKQAQDLSKVYEMMLSIKGSKYDIFLNNISKELVTLGENGATVNEQSDYFAHFLNTFVEESSYADWLDMVNQELVAMANNQASVNDMMAKYNDLSSQRNSALANSATIDSITSNPEKYANVDFTGIAAGSLGESYVNQDIQKAIREGTESIVRSIVVLTTVTDRSSANNYGYNTLQDINPTARAMVYSGGGIGNLATSSATAGFAGGRVWNKGDELGAISKAYISGWAESMKGKSVSILDPKIKELADFADAAADAMDVFADALNSLERGISSLNSTMGTLSSLTDSIYSGDPEYLKAQFYSSLSAAKTLEGQVQADPTNIDLISAYNSAVSDFSKYTSAYLQTSNFQTNQDYLMAQAVAGNASGSMYETASKTEILLEKLSVLTEITNSTLADGNITALEAKSINQTATDVLQSGTVGTADSGAYSWLALVKNATADGVVSTDELKAVTAGVAGAINDQDSNLFTIASKTAGTETNTGKIGRYNVTNTYGQIPTNDVGGYIVDVVSQEFTPYKKGGYTGDYGVDDIAGIVHGQEYVVNAQTTKDLGLNGSGGLFQTMVQELVSLNRSVSDLNAITIAQANEIRKLRKEIEDQAA